MSKKRIKSSGFVGRGAKVEKTGSTFAVKHGKTGEVLSRHTTKAAAQQRAQQTRDANRTSTSRSRKNTDSHGS